MALVVGHVRPRLQGPLRYERDRVAPRWRRALARAAPVEPQARQTTWQAGQRTDASDARYPSKPEPVKGGSDERSSAGASVAASRLHALRRDLYGAGGIPEVWSRFVTRAQARGLDLEKSTRLGVAHDDPAITQAEKCRYDAYRRA